MLIYFVYLQIFIRYIAEQIIFHHFPPEQTNDSYNFGSIGVADEASYVGIFGSGGTENI